MNDESHNSGIMKYLIDESDAEKFFHSSGYAREAYHNNIGSDREQSDTFSARQDLEQNRQFVRGYKDAGVISDVGKARAIGNAKQSQQVTAKVEAKKGALGESVNGLRRGDRSSFGISNRSESGNATDSTGGGRFQNGGTRGASTSAAPSGPATPPARRNPGILR